MEYMASVEGRNFLITHLVAEIASLYYELEAYDNQLLNLGRNIKIQQQALAVVQELKTVWQRNKSCRKTFPSRSQKKPKQAVSNPAGYCHSGKPSESIAGSNTAKDQSSLQ